MSVGRSSTSAMLARWVRPNGHSVGSTECGGQSALVSKATVVCASALLWGLLSLAVACGGRELGSGSDDGDASGSASGSYTTSGRSESGHGRVSSSGSDGGTRDAGSSRDATVIDSSSSSPGRSGSSTQSGSSGGSGSSTGSNSSSSTGSPCDASACIPGEQQCLDSTHIETCGSDCQWGSPWPCATGVCSGGACTGTTTVEPPSCAPGGPGMSDCLNGDAGQA